MNRQEMLDRIKELESYIDRIEDELSSCRDAYAALRRNETKYCHEIDSKDLTELKRIRTYLQHLGFNVDELTQYLQAQEQAEQPDLFPGPLFDNDDLTEEVRNYLGDFFKGAAFH